MAMWPIALVRVTVGGGRRQFGVFHQRDVVMRHLAIVVGTVELHRARRTAVAARPDRADLLQADDLGPEPMRFCHVANVDDQMVDADGCDRVGLHENAPRVVVVRRVVAGA